MSVQDAKTVASPLTSEPEAARAREGNRQCNLWNGSEALNPQKKTHLNLQARVPCRHTTIVPRCSSCGRHQDATLLTLMRHGSKG